jgi:PAS domain S-box-containing protein
VDVPELGAEEALPEERYRSMVEAAAEGMVMRRADGVISVFNAAAERILGLSAAQMQGAEPFHPGWYTLREDGTILPPEERPNHVVLRTGDAVHDYVLGVHKPDGRVTWVSVNTQPMFRRGERAPYAVVAIYRDITEQRRLVEALEQSHQRFRNAFEHSGIGIALARLDGRWTQVNAAFCRIMGYTREELLALDYQRITHPDDHAHDTPIDALLAGDIAVHEAEKRYVHKDGHPVWVHLTVSVLRNAAGEPQSLIAQVHDISERRRVEEQLQDAEQRLLVAMRASKTSFFDWDLERGELRHDERFYIWAGVPAVLRGGLDEICAAVSDPEDLPALRDAVGRVRDGAAQALVIEHRRPGEAGRERWVRASGIPVDRDAQGRARRLCGTVADITAWKELQARAGRAERMASLGTLVAGMSHEINNPLACVVSNVQYAHEQLAAQGERKDDVLVALSDAAASARRVRDIVADLKAFAAGHASRSSRCSLVSVVDRALKIAHHGLVACAEVSVELPPLPDVAASEAELVQVFAALLVNAGQATGRAPNRVIVTAAHDGEGQITARVADTGVGIPPALLPRVFDPFFTTRGIGAGKGLGLSVSLGIVRKLGGQIEIESTPDKGTSVIVTVPACS